MDVRGAEAAAEGVERFQRQGLVSEHEHQVLAQRLPDGFDLGLFERCTDSDALQLGSDARSER